MAKSNSFHVRPTESNNWEVRVEGGSEASSIHPSQTEAADRARELAKGSVNGKVVIHGKDGAIRREFSYGPDPRAATNVASNRFRQCYISAPLGTNISLLRHTFEERDVACIDQGDFRPGVPLLQEIERALDRSDFVCAVVPRATSHESVLFEMGVARGKHRPILVFADFGTDLPYFLRGIPYSRASLKDKAAIEGHVDAFLEHSSADTVRGTVDSIGASAEQPKRVDTSWAALALTASEAGEAVALEAIVSRLFQDAGMVTSEPLVHGTGEQGNTLRPDFALWIDELQDFLGNPILVEIKYGFLDARRIESAEEQLRRYVLGIQGQSGLLVYFDKSGGRFPPFSGTWPLIIRMSLQELMEALERGQLPQTLASIRNRAVHAGD